MKNMLIDKQEIYNYDDINDGMGKNKNLTKKKLLESKLKNMKKKKKVRPLRKLIQGKIQTQTFEKIEQGNKGILKSLKWFLGNLIWKLKSNNSIPQSQISSGQQVVAHDIKSDFRKTENE